MSIGRSIETDYREVLPTRRQLYYGGAFHEPDGGYGETINPATGESLGAVAEANAADVALAVKSAHQAFQSWRLTKPLERAALLRKLATILRNHSDEFALIDAANCGNPVSEMARDAGMAAAQVELFAGLVTELKGDTIPMGDGVVNMTLREPIGVCARIVAYNHPLMFVAGKAAAALAAGNTVIMKAPPQAPLSAYRLAELIHGLFPPGVFNILSGGVECGEALTSHPLVPMVTLIGSAPTGRSIVRGGAESLKRVLLELGGKNALVIFPDAHVERAIDGAVKGMNFTWCGQSCGSTSRLFIHDSLYDRVVASVVERVKLIRPGIPTDPSTKMGAIVSKVQHDKILRYIGYGIDDGAQLLAGGKIPEDPSLAKGFFVEPTVFAGVTPDMRIAREEIFGPILSILRWNDEDDLYRAINDVEYGLTASIFTSGLANAHRAAARIEAGYIWINNTSLHFVGVPFGGFKQSGIGREESIDELLAFTQQKNVNITL
jgi:betaine-aldehyde dehydrogenase